MSSNLNREGFDVKLAAGGKGDFAKKIEKENIAYYNIKNFQRNVSFLKDFFAFFEILRLLFKLKPNIVHVNSPKAGGIVGLAAFIYKIYNLINPHLISPLIRGRNRGGQKTFRLDKLSTIYTPHGWAFSENRPAWQIFLIKLFSKITAVFYNKIICVSEYDLKKALEYNITSPKKLTKIYNGIDIKNLEFLEKKEAKKSLYRHRKSIQRSNYDVSNFKSSFVIGTVAEMTKNKGLIYLLKAFKKLQHQKSVIKDLTLMIIASGENPDKNKIVNYIKENKISNVKIIENLPNAVSYLKAFDIFVLPSIKEGLPYSIIEAMAAGLPVIGTNVGGIPELLKNNGIIIQQKNSQEMAEKIIFLINNSEKRKELGDKSEKAAKENFNLKKMLEETKKLYL